MHPRHLWEPSTPLSTCLTASVLSPAHPYPHPRSFVHAGGDTATLESSESWGHHSVAKTFMVPCRSGYRKDGDATATTSSSAELTVEKTVTPCAQRRWRLLRAHVRVPRRRLNNRAFKHARQFTVAKKTLLEACVEIFSTTNDPLDLIQALWTQVVVLFETEWCRLHFKLAPAMVMKYEGQDFRPSTDLDENEMAFARQQARGALHLSTFYSTAKACTEARIIPPNGCISLQSYLCLPLVDCHDHVQAIVEVFNSRHKACEIQTWLTECESASVLPIRPLREFCGFLGALLRAASLIEALEHPPSRINSSSSRTDNDTSEGILVLFGILQRALDVDGWTIYVYDQEANTLWARLASASSVLSQTRVSTAFMGHGIIGRAALRGKPLFDTNVLCVPLLSTSRPPMVTSVIVFHTSLRHKHRLFRPCDIDFCRLLCGQVEPYLQRIALEDAMKKAQAVLAVSDLVFRQLEQVPKASTLLDTVAHEIERQAWIQTTKCTVYLRDPFTHELYVPRDAMDRESRTNVPSGSACAMAAVRTGNIVNIRETETGLLFCTKHGKFVMAVPIKDPSSGAVLAVLEFQDKSPDTIESSALMWLEKGYFDLHDEDIARAIAHQLASALRHIQRLDAARIAERKSAALLALRLPAATGTMPGEQAGAVFSFAEATVCKALNASHGALFLVDAPSRTLFARVGADWRGYTIPIGQKLQGRVAATGAAIRLQRDARQHSEFDTEYDRIVGFQTSSLLCVPIKAQPSLCTSLSVPGSMSLGSGGRSGRRCSSSFSTCSSTDDDSDDWPVIGVFYAVNKTNRLGDVDAFDAEDEQVLRAICVELSALVERRAWELVFESPSYDDSDSSDSDGESHVTRTFLSQYTTASPIRRRRRPRSRLPSVVSDLDHAASVVAATLYHEGCFLGPTSSSNSLLASISSPIQAAPGHGSCSPVLQWHLDPWQFSPAQLIDLSVDMFALHDLVNDFALPEATLRRFLQSVQTQYLDVPYHNTYHAFATLHTAFLLVSAQSRTLAPLLVPASTALGVHPTTKAQAMEKNRQKRCGELLLAPRERLAVFIAAFCHDMGHDARTNDFHVRCSSRMARRYNDHSVLENMHAAACFETMRRPGHDVFAGLEDGSSAALGNRRAVRKRIIRAILATDMHRHASIVAKLHEAQIRANRNDEEALRELLVNAVVHSADLSGPAQTEAQHFNWTARLLQEFNEQHAEEVELGISATAFMDGRPDSAEFARVNLAFVDSCAFPLWKALSGMLAGLEGCLANVERNRTMWANRLQATEGDGKKEKRSMSELILRKQGRAGQEEKGLLSVLSPALKFAASLQHKDLQHTNDSRRTSRRSMSTPQQHVR
ncbi:hypothetical protein CCR75_006871 [Bremia lactucae]|uniref:Phosphodiesterase n=1 Tax=Bremia lactucae TaxID=4779 RepID=A0A976IH87_BRELC|nr:hypothetical protein CCR75_006871 [Bremia lactucae]